MIKYQKAVKIINKVSLKLPNEKISTLNSLNRVMKDGELLNGSKKEKITRK